MEKTDHEKWPELGYWPQLGNFTLLTLGKKISPLVGRPRGVGPPSVHLGPPNISENTRARKLKLKMPLDIVKYSPRVQKFFR